MNKNAIVVYIDKSEKCQIEFSWLWKSWLMWDINEKWDIIALTNPEVIDKVKSTYEHKDCKFIPLEPSNKPGTIWAGYGFVNSFAMFDSKEVNEIVDSYEYLLKTDCDTFLTKWFKDFVPASTRIYIGNGGYYPLNWDEEGKAAAEEISKKIKATANAFGLKHRNISHVGATILAKKDLLKSVVMLQKSITEKLLLYGWPKGETGNWPGWFKGVSSMYAIEIAVNALVQPMQIHQGSFDCYCANNKMSNLDLHIHAWQQTDADVFNKKLWHENKLPKVAYKYMPNTAGGYCLMIANGDLDSLKEIARNV